MIFSARPTPFSRWRAPSLSPFPPGTVSGPFWRRAGEDEEDNRRLAVVVGGGGASC